MALFAAVARSFVCSFETIGRLCNGCHVRYISGVAMQHRDAASRCSEHDSSVATCALYVPCTVYKNVKGSF